MRHSYHLPILYLASLSTIICFVQDNSFNPDTTSYDAYGLKVAANDFMLVESQPDQSWFYVVLAPFQYSFNCLIWYDNNIYVYAVALARHVANNDSKRFVFIGMNTSTNQPFIGSQEYSGISGAAYVAMGQPANDISFVCDGLSSDYNIHTLNNYTFNTASNNNLNFFVVAVEPTGHFAYAFAQSFVLIYNLDTNTTYQQPGNETWRNSSFIPSAVDISSNQSIVVLGYVILSSNRYIPCAYLLRASQSSLSVLDQWFYTTNVTWQTSVLDCSGIPYPTKCATSVSINSAKNEVLLGIQIINTFVLLGIDEIAGKFVLPAHNVSQGVAIGMGKSVAWLDSQNAMILVNTYSLNYIWTASQVCTYNLNDSTNFVISRFPNIYQQLAPTFGPEIITLVATENGTVVMLDAYGNVYIILQSPAGSFSDTSQDSISTSSPCRGGMYQSQASVLPCSLCPSATSTGGRSGQSSCGDCANDTFCPLGAAFGNIASSSPYLINISHAYPYPVSPQSTRFDNILIENMFLIQPGASAHCLVVTASFWALLFIALGLIIMCVVFFLKYCVKGRRGEEARSRLISFFKQTDIISEGEMWIGGILSFPIFILAVFGYVFSGLYIQRYPIETLTGNASFACDPTLTNAQFSSGLMSLAIPTNADQQPMFDLLNEQEITLTVDLVNTNFTCNDLSLTQVKGISVSITNYTCTGDNSGILSMTVLLPSNTPSLQLTLSGTQTIGGVRLSLRGPSADEENSALNAVYALAELEFAQFFYVPGRALSQQPSFTIQLTKLVNRTYPLDEKDEMNFTGVWISYINPNLDQNFLTQNDYVFQTNSNTVLSITLTETAYYTLNIQRPITDKAELIFTNLLYTIVCIEIFGLLFLIVKLVVIPLASKLVNCCRRRPTAKEKSKPIDESELHRF